jgi:hypothetical protein
MTDHLIYTADGEEIPWSTRTGPRVIHAPAQEHLSPVLTLVEYESAQEAAEVFAADDEMRGL